MSNLGIPTPFPMNTMAMGGLGPMSNMPQIPMPQFPPQMAMSNQNNTLYVGDLPSEAGQQEIYQHFLQYGNVTGVQHIPRKNNGEICNFAFVSYGSYAEASNAKNNG